MNKELIEELLNTYDIIAIEKHLIYLYLKNKGLSQTENQIIADFLNDFNPHPSLISILSTLKIDDLRKMDSFLELLILKKDRKMNGAFFTPSYIVDYIINELVPKENNRCLDPSCGSGAFLLGLVEYFRCNFNKSVKRILSENIFGSDILEYNTRRAKILLSIYGLEQGENIEETEFNVFNQDSLKADWQSEFDVIVGNPPYVKFQDLSDDNRSYLLSDWKTTENGTFNLYFAFFELGYKLLSPNGRLGYITPNNYFTSLAGLALRQYFSQKKCLNRVLDFRHKKVFDAQTYTAISFINKKVNDFILFDKIKENQTCNEFLISANGSPNYLENLDVKKWRLLKTDEQENIKKIETIGTPIKKLFNIAVGIATLKDEVFFVDDKNEKDGFLKKITENGTFLIEKEVTKSVYKISQFKSQSDIENNTLRIITPYDTSPKTASPILEKDFQEKYPKCYEYLLSEKEKLKNRDKGKNDYYPFYVWGRTQGITRFGKKLLSPTFSKNPRFLFVAEEDAYYTNGYGIYFDKDRSEDLSLFADFTHPMSKEENILVVQKILNSIVMDYYVSNTSVSIQGGFPCYQKNFIEKFTIPHFTDAEIDLLDNLSDKTEINEFLIEKYQINLPSSNLSE